MKPELKSICDQLSNQFDSIAGSRKLILHKIANYMQKKIDKNESINLVYLCTHNSRRSHFGQIWGKVAADYYGIKNVLTYSAGTEVTAMHPNTVQTLKDHGFTIKSEDNNPNPYYFVHFDERQEPIVCFSKTIDHPSIPNEGFIALMTCSEAEENCPFVPGAEYRMSTTYEDPKAFDGTPQQDEKYKERSLQIALDSLYICSLIHR